MSAWYESNIGLCIVAQQCAVGGEGMILALTNSKGGVGKSTLSVHLAVWLKEQGHAVTLVDADVQGSSSIWLSEVDPSIPLVRLQTPDDVLDQLPKIRERFESVVVDGPAGLSEVTRAILLTADLTFLPCGPSVLALRAANEAAHGTAEIADIAQQRWECVREWWSLPTGEQDFGIGVS
jgi:chromosome partitioning protein